MTLSDIFFERSTEFNLKEYLKNHFGIWREEPVDILLRFDKIVATTIEERAWHPTQKIKHLKSGDVELSMKVGPSEELIAWILRWGHFCEVLKPHDLRETIRDRLLEALILYK